LKSSLLNRYKELLVSILGFFGIGLLGLGVMCQRS